MRAIIARWIGRLVWRWSTARREIVLANLIPVVGVEQAKRVGPQLLSNFFLNTADFIFPASGSQNAIHFENSELVDSIIRQYGRAILLTAHFGNWEMGVRWLAQQTYPASGIYAIMHNRVLSKWLHRFRPRTMEWASTEETPYEFCLEALKKGRVLGLVGDLPFGEKGRAVHMFNRTARLPLGPWVLAHRTGTPVIPAWILRQPDNTYLGRFEEPIFPIAQKPLRAEVARMQDIFRAQLESRIQKNPEQWSVLQPFWEK